MILSDAVVVVLSRDVGTCSVIRIEFPTRNHRGKMNPMGGHGTLGSCAHHHACANESLVADLKGNITKVMGHPAILGYCACLCLWFSPCHLLYLHSEEDYHHHAATWLTRNASL